MSAIRRVVPGDVPALVGLIFELAGYERAADQCHITVDRLRDSLFADSPALFAHVAEVDGEVVGCALWFLNYSTWRGGHGIYLEDLYVRPGMRGRGLGKALLTALARECVEHGYHRLEWSVLDWNTPGIDFYKSLGAFPMDGWTTYRLTDDALRELGTPPPGVVG